ncbi:hypothetical protein [Pandoraea thiooxydans]|uniref:hypothetical protein n=1 Tax=Pandoraea thiooxydans TaxID=445709 RepID=UPI0012EC3537|nr:hypothetical protein [Pandoraea thiooxydans]
MTIQVRSDVASPKGNSSQLEALYHKRVVPAHPDRPGYLSTVEERQFPNGTIFPELEDKAAVATSLR